MFDYSQKPELNITPLVDVMLVLLAILMVTTPAIIYEENISLPDGSKKEVSNLTSENIIIRIDDKRKVYINKESMSFSEFSDNIVLKSANLDLNSPVYIQADKNLIYNDVMYILKTLKQAGFTKISLQTAG
ncbi:biopolymer transporter ExbD [Campylobacter ureolyticus]|jgi:exbd\tolr family transport protein|uniref:Biopolymer transporter ExbD n=1 Tax=Campylobacter ureolyticus TaxID=827 RepID=A0A2I1N8W2_9BACT|nr:biopolymer transporter ExbD [Campylobacter ureolyticus]MCZ6103815.1 biopolymer transporter ExbD [Campylobacter ureolyticus]MCZ6105854.1 biopolymer transporter ExbD [Campylobacter ureolyticus]MCZ6111731.1 biopolymer transporter ExbD [Campylobacter ureolyticus]MCZ6117747.1 biopolymer transporter ExbD [Campylobacter ureolyticus]MCZ6134733.1 biopolymer transporter ExbD [Campylobacter ureolyticus]